MHVSSFKPLSNLSLQFLLVQHIEAALDVEEASLSQIHRTVGKQISRLQLEERMLRMLHDRLLEEAGLARAAAMEPGQPSLHGEEEDRKEEDTKTATNDAKMNKKSKKTATGRARGGRKAGANAAGRSISRDKARPSPKKPQK